MAYSVLLSRVEPESKGRGRFNYHLKILKEAGLIDIAGAQYRLTPSGAVAAQLLAQSSKNVPVPPRRRTQLTIIGSLIGGGGLGLLLLLSTVLAPVLFDAPGIARDPGWNIPAFVSELNHEAANPQVAADAKGNAIVIWTQDDGPSINVWANRFKAGLGWEEAKLIERSDSGDASSPRLVIDLAGNAWAVWQQSVSELNQSVFPGRREAAGEIWANRFVPEDDWEEARLIKRAAELGDIALDASGALTIIWNEFRGGRGFAIHAARFVPGTGWTDPKALHDDRQDPLTSPGVQLAVNAEGRGMAVWYGGDGGIYASQFVPNGGWGPVILVGAGLDFDGAEYPSIAMDSEGNAIAVWYSHIDDSSQKGVYAARFVPGPGWGEAVLIGRDVANGRLPSAPQVAVDTEGNAMAVWSQVRPNEVWVDIFVNHFDLDLGWDDPRRIAEKVGVAGFVQDSGEFALAVEPAGDAVLLYDDSNRGIFVVRYVDGGGWTIPSLIDTGGAQCDPCPPAVAINPSGNVFAVWEESTSAPFGLLASRVGEATELEKIMVEIFEQMEEAASRAAETARWLAVSLSLLVASIVLIGVLFVVYWNPGRGLGVNREIR